VIVLLMWAAQFIYFFIQSSMGVLGPALKTELHLSNTAFGILCGAIGLGTTVFQVPAGLWCDRAGVRRVITSAFLLLAVCTFIFSLSADFLFACVGLLWLGFAIGCSQIAGTKAIVDWFPFAGRASAMGIKQTSGNAGGIAVSIILPFLLGLYDWRLLIRFMAIVALLFAVLVVSMYRDVPSIDGKLTSGGSVGHSLRSLKHRHFLLVLAAGIFLTAAQFSFSSYLILYLSQSLHYSLKISGVILAFAFGVGALSRVGWGMISDYVLKNREMILVIIGGVGALVCAALAFLTPSSPIWVLYLISVFSGISIMGWTPIWMTLAGELSGKNSAGAGIGLSYFFGNLGVAFGPPLFGLIADGFQSYSTAWLFPAVCMVIASSIFLLCVRLLRGAQSPPEEYFAGILRK
jgi:sugar phosphate permease